MEKLFHKQDTHIKDSKVFETVEINATDDNLDLMRQSVITERKGNDRLSTADDSMTFRSKTSTKGHISQNANTEVLALKYVNIGVDNNDELNNNKDVVSELAKSSKAKPETKNRLLDSSEHQCIASSLNDSISTCVEDLTDCKDSETGETHVISSTEARRLAWRRNRYGSGDSHSSSFTDELVSESVIRERRSSIVDALLFEIYDRWHSFDSDTFTECSSTSDAFFGRTDSVRHQLEEEHGNKINRTFLETKDVGELRDMLSDIQRHITSLSARLIRQLKHRDRRLAKVQKHCDIVTAILQASSLKRRVDSKIRFSIDPLPGEDAFCQWKDAMRAVARLPLGIPGEFRRKVWLALADNYLSSLKIDWNKTKRFAFNERSNPDDNKLGLQIVKDLHRTGCSGFSGHDNEEERALLKRVLLAYARWNKQVGYCQGFNVLAALILDVVERKEDDALKIMIYLIDHVLPSSYFTNNLRALSVDMAVFRDLLNMHIPDLSKHLDYLQKAARDDTTGANYEPPLTNVFTMQWFLTLFATCLPKDTALRVWDSVLLEGSEILLRTALAIWDKLKERIMEIDSADEFYSTMGVLTQEMLDCAIIDADELIKTIYTMAQFPFPQMGELREKYTYNITPFSAAMSTGGQRSRKSGMTSIFSDDDDLEDEEMIENIGCFTGMFPISGQISPTRTKSLSDSDRSPSSFDISKASPGAYGVTPQQLDLASVYAERMSLDLYALKQQYKKVRQRQKQAHIILTAANARHQANIQRDSKPNVVHMPRINTMAPPIESPVAVNHLFLGRDMRKHMKSHGKNRAIVEAPKIASLYGSTPVPVTCSAKMTQNVHAYKGKLSPAKDNYSIFSKAAFDDLSSDNFPMFERADSTMSLDSEVSATSLSNHTKTESSFTGSMSDVSTVCGDSEIDDAVSKEGKTFDHFKPNDKNYEHVCTQEGICESHDSLTEERTDMDSNNCYNVPSNNKAEKQSDSEHSPDDAENDNTVMSETKNVHNNSSVQSFPVQGRPTLLQLSQQMSSTDNNGEPIDVNSVNITGTNDASLTHIKPQPAESSSKLSTSPSDNEERHNDIKPSRSMVRHHHIHTDTTSHDTSISPRLSPSHSQALNKEPKVFNPFPSQHISRRRAANGIKLGLYSADNVPQLEVGMVKCGVPKPIGRAQINACLHRQYMEDVKQRTKTSKR